MTNKIWYHTLALNRNHPTESWWTCDRSVFAAEAARQFQRMRWSRFAHTGPSREGRGMGTLDLWRAKKAMRGAA